MTSAVFSAIQRPRPAAAPRAARRPRTAIRAGALTVSLVLHVAALGAGAWITSGASSMGSAPDDPGDSRYEARIVVVAPDETRGADDAIPVPARPDAAPRASRDAAGDAPIAAMHPDEADEEAPPPPAPSIAVLLVEGGRARPRPREWSPTPTSLRGSYFGRGHGSRRTGSDGRGGAGGAGGGDGTAIAASEPQAMIEAPQAAPPREAVRVAARLVKYAPPVYPDSARSRGLEGAVRVEVEVLEDGTAGEVRIVESSGLQAFDDAAVRAVRRWSFEAARVDGVAVRSTIALPVIRFRLE